jgi:hypothetical protein
MTRHVILIESDCDCPSCVAWRIVNPTSGSYRSSAFAFHPKGRRQSESTDNDNPFRLPTASPPTYLAKAINNAVGLASGCVEFARS